MITVIPRIKEFLGKVVNTLLYPLIILSKKLILPGFKGIPLYDVTVFFLRGLRRGYLTQRARAVSFSFILAALPAMLFFFSLIPYIPIEGLHTMILQTLQDIMPGNAYFILDSTIEDIVLNHRGGLLSFGFIGSIYFFSNGIMGLMNAFNLTSHTLETRTAFYRRLISLILVLVLSILVIASTGTMIATSFIIEYLTDQGILKSGFSIFLVQTGKVILLLGMLILSFSVTYYVAPAKRGSISFLSPGAIFGSFLALIVLQVFAFMIDNFGQQNKLYGSLGTIIVILIWVNLITQIILIGFELNASIYGASKAHQRKNE